MRIEGGLASGEGGNGRPDEAVEAGSGAERHRLVLAGGAELQRVRHGPEGLGVEGKRELTVGARREGCMRRAERVGRPTMDELNEATLTLGRKGGGVRRSEVSTEGRAELAQGGMRRRSIGGHKRLCNLSAVKGRAGLGFAARSAEGPRNKKRSA